MIKAETNKGFIDVKLEGTLPEITTDLVELVHSIYTHLDEKSAKAFKQVFKKVIQDDVPFVAEEAKQPMSAMDMVQKDAHDFLDFLEGFLDECKRQRERGEKTMTKEEKIKEFITTLNELDESLNKTILVGTKHDFMSDYGKEKLGEFKALVGITLKHISKELEKENE